MKMKKKAQVTIFVIIFIAIIVVGIILYFLYPKLKISFFGEEINPNNYMQQCLEDELKNNIKLMSLQGGSLNPEHYILYKDNKIEYLCYTEEYYKTCVMQRPFLISFMEKEISTTINKKVDECLSLMSRDYEKRGYSVEINKKSIITEILPKRIRLNIDGNFKFSKEDVKTYSTISISLNNNLYELLTIAHSILNWEARYGEAETTFYMTLYKNLKVEKIKQSEGSTVYIITERKTGNKFQFASRSIAWPQGMYIR